VLGFHQRHSRQPFHGRKHINPNLTLRYKIAKHLANFSFLYILQQNQASLWDINFGVPYTLNWVLLDLKEVVCWSVYIYIQVSMLSMSEANKYGEGGSIIKQIIRILYYCRKRHKRRVFYEEAAVILLAPLPHLQPDPLLFQCTLRSVHNKT